MYLAAIGNMCHTEGFCHALLKKVESAGYKVKQWGAGSNRLFFLTTEFQPVNGQNDCEKQRIYKRKKKKPHNTNGAHNILLRFSGLLVEIVS